VIQAKHTDLLVREVNQHATSRLTVRELAPRGDRSELRESEHFVQFYETDRFLVETLSEFIGAGLGAGEAAIVVATQAHREELDERLQSARLDVVAARASGQYVVLDAAETLAKFMVEGSPDPDRFAETLEGIIARVAARGQRVRIFGEMVALLWAEGQYDAAIRLEALWNNLHAIHSFVLYCAYPIHGFGQEALATPLSAVCDEHSRVIPAESYTALTSSDERLRAIILLQQKASVLQAEIAERKAAEDALRTVKDELEVQLEVREQLLVREQMARAEAEHANRMKDQFLTVAAHELRTPLTTLMGQAQLFQRRAERERHLSERDHRTLQIINDQVARLNKLVLALLDVSRLETGQLTIERVPLDICVLAHRVVREIMPTADDRRIELICPERPVFVNGDELRLEQVLQNLIQNALRYSRPPEPIIVTVTSQAATACIAVQDRGIGIPRDALPRLFQRFYRAKNAEEQHIGGMGIGLHVVKEIVTLHGGTIEVESSEGAGSTFTVCLPRCAENDPA
jgi:signal transduction histidine kinase